MLSVVKSLYLIFCGSVQTPATPDMTRSRLTRWAAGLPGAGLMSIHIRNIKTQGTASIPQYPDMQLHVNIGIFG